MNRSNGGRQPVRLIQFVVPIALAHTLNRMNPSSLVGPVCMAQPGDEIRGLRLHLPDLRCGVCHRIHRVLSPPASRSLRSRCSPLIPRLTPCRTRHQPACRAARSENRLPYSLCLVLTYGLEWLHAENLQSATTDQGQCAIDRRIDPIFIVAESSTTQLVISTRLETLRRAFRTPRATSPRRQLQHQLCNERPGADGSHPIGYGHRRAIGLSYFPAGSRRISHFHVPVQTDAHKPTQPLMLSDISSFEMGMNARKTFRRTRA